MNIRQVGLGVSIWSVGLIVPLLYHAYLMEIASNEDGFSYSYHNIVNHFFDLPWIVWPYLLAMTLVGTIVVRAGLKKP